MTAEKEKILEVITFKTGFCRASARGKKLSLMVFLKFPWLANQDLTRHIFRFCTIPIAPQSMIKALDG